MTTNGVVRTVAAVPAVLGSLLLLLLGFGWLGGGVVFVLAGWLGCAALVLTVPGERLAVRLICRFRRPTLVQAASLAGPWAAALECSGLSVGAFDLYVDRGPVPNAYAAGRRTVAVSVGALSACATGTDGGDRLTALLLHELGHHKTGACHPMLAMCVLTAPWSAVVRLVMRLVLRLRGRQSGTAVAVVSLACASVAVVQAVAAGQPVLGVGVVALVVATVLGPLLGAAACRRDERLADEFVARCGRSAVWAAWLSALPGGPRPLSPVGWVMSGHPSATARVRRLTDAAR